MADDADHFTLFDGKADVVQRLEQRALATFLPINRAPVLSRVCLRPCMAPRRYSLVRWSTSMMGMMISG